MSTKTNFKRVALVAVASLGLGVLTSVAPANAAASNLSIWANAAVTATAATNAAASGGASYGLLATGGSTTTQTATLLASGTLAVYSTFSSSGNVVTTVTGGVITAQVDADGVTIGGGAAYDNDSAYGLLITPTAGATTMTIKHYYGATSANGTTSGGTLADQIVVTIAATSAYGLVNAGESSVKIASAANTAGTTETDVTSANYNVESSGHVYGSISLADVYGNAVSTGGTLIATVTGGAVVDLDASAVATGTLATDYLTVAASEIYFKVSQGTSGVAAAWTLTITHSTGGLLATKSGLIKGITSKAIISTPKFGMTSTNSADSFTVTFQDAAGNATYPTASNASASLISSYANATVTAAAIRQYPTASGTVGYGNFTCGSLSASTPIKLKFVLSTGATVESNEVKATCSGVPAAFTASLDKATYTPGSVATVTIKPLDSKGNPSNDYYTLTQYNSTSGSAAAADQVSFVGAPGTVVTAPAQTDAPTSGAKTYQFIVGTTEGDFNMVVDVPAIRSANNSAGGTQAKITVPYSIKASSGAVSNADVLKAIVSLIASINKQIAALQKALLKR
jgi:hypothetical protein